MRPVSESNTLVRREPVGNGRAGIGDPRQPNTCFIHRARPVADAAQDLNSQVSGLVESILVGFRHGKRGMVGCPLAGLDLDGWALIEFSVEAAPIAPAPPFRDCDLEITDRLPRTHVVHEFGLVARVERFVIALSRVTFGPN